MMHSRRTSARRGFTLIETLVVAGIAAVLLAIAIPTIGAIRESARRMECQNRQKQIGLAMHEHLAAHGNYVEIRFAGPCDDYLMTSAFSKWLPYLGHQAVFDRIPPCHISIDIGDGEQEPRLPDFICPSDDALGNLNFRLCTGSGPTMWPVSERSDFPKYDGVFPPAVGQARETDLTDGKSHTIGMSEKLTTIGNGIYDVRRSLWGSGVVLEPIESDALLSLCANAPANPYGATTWGGRFWHAAAPVSSNYNHVAPPNWRGVDCNPHIANVGIQRATSAHTRGVNCLYMDGHVSFVSDGVDLTVWRALATRAGRDDAGALP